MYSPALRLENEKVPKSGEILGELLDTGPVIERLKLGVPKSSISPTSILITPSFAPAQLIL